MEDRPENGRESNPQRKGLKQKPQALPDLGKKESAPKGAPTQGPGEKRVTVRFNEAEVNDLKRKSAQMGWDASHLIREAVGRFNPNRGKASPRVAVGVPHVGARPDMNLANCSQCGCQPSVREPGGLARAVFCGCGSWFCTTKEWNKRNFKG